MENGIDLSSNAFMLIHGWTAGSRKICLGTNSKHPNPCGYKNGYYRGSVWAVTIRGLIGVFSMGALIRDPFFGGSWDLVTKVMSTLSGVVSI